MFESPIMIDAHITPHTDIEGSADGDYNHLVTNKINHEDEFTRIDHPINGHSKCRADDIVRCRNNPTVEICEVQLCDGIADCPNGEDEDRCPIHSGI